MIYIGYQGIGKSTICKKIDKCIDLESSNFRVDGKRDSDWYKVYGNIAKHLSDQGKIVFTSAHMELRNYFNEQGIEYTVIYPSENLKEEWIKKLEERYELEPTQKNMNALLRARTHYCSDILDFMEEKNGIEKRTVSKRIRRSILFKRSYFVKFI